MDFRNSCDNFFPFLQEKKKNRVGEEKQHSPICLAVVRVADSRGRELSSSPFVGCDIHGCCFCFEFTIVRNLSREPVLYVSTRFDPWRTVCASGKPKVRSIRCVFVLLRLQPISRMPNRIGEEWCSRRTLSLLNFYEHSNELQNLFQVSTVNRIFFCLFYWSVFCWMLQLRNISSSLYRLSELFYMKVNLNMSRALFSSSVSFECRRQRKRKKF